MGNIYINHNMIGAVVGVQPFGGEGLSGTGLNAGANGEDVWFGSDGSGRFSTRAIGQKPGSGDPMYMNLTLQMPTAQ